MKKFAIILLSLLFGSPFIYGQQIDPQQIQWPSGCTFGLFYSPFANTCGTGSSVSNVSNSDGTLSITPTTGAVIASIALAHPNIWTGTQTFSASLGFDASSATQIKLPVGAGYTSAANGEIGYDSTNSNWHGWNGADRIFVPLASGFVSGHCGQPTSTSGKWEIADTGSACAANSLSGMTSGQVAIAGSSSTITSSKALAGTGAGIVTGPTTSTAGDIVDYADASGTTQDSGTLLSSLAPKASPVFSGTPDCSGCTQFKLPVAASGVSAATGEVIYDSTNKNWHIWKNGADSLLIPFPISPTSGDCYAPTLSSGVWSMVDAGGPCGVSGGGVTAFSGDGTLLNNSSSTGSVTATLANAGAYAFWGNNAGSTGAPGYHTIPAAGLPSGILSCSEVWGGSGTSFALTSGDDAISNNTCYNDSGSTRTITAVKCRSDNASNTTTVNPTFGSAGTGTTILSGALTCGSSLAYSSSGTVSNASRTTGSGINPVMSGTLTGTSIAVIIEYHY